MIKKQEIKKFEKGNKIPKNYKVLKIIIAVVIIILIVFFIYRYIEEIKEKAYINGGKDAVKTITSAVINKGGVVIKNNNEVIILSKYDKEINGIVSTMQIKKNANQTTTENTNQTITE